MQIRADINKILNRKAIERVNKIQSCFFEKVNKVDKPLARLQP